MRPHHLAALAALSVLVPAMLSAQSAEPRRLDSPFRPPVNFVEQNPAPPIPPDVTDDRRVARNYPEQPPVIPHNVRDYQITLNNNQCLTCHSRRFTEAVQAPMVSITHYVDREGQTLGAVSPRRYFCMQCHVPQTTAQPIVPNSFKDLDTLVSRPSDRGDRP
ncbi:cytochrome C [Azospirillum sp. TSH100]|uniref:nitrate reductase cytochrome c-type subunit n=1 Tax=Azospirillum sp. TSH100 TaxID=652764 RepID=UPI000D608855|nr:nitrate reductase cytochrome c-type subunit [Azospirillum sp. TSH100]PWC83303.1 cytochrome C [Azospirillum sp. TSH100]QCG90431.1 nitrate reductase cytochrome c-type subunit [Azospirillum sp. TSH100]